MSSELEMNSVELVQKAIEFGRPSRMPIYYFNRDIDRSDVVCGWCGPASDFRPSEEGETEWGYVWENLGDGTMGQPKNPPIPNLARLASYVPPDPFAPGRADHLDQFIAQNADKFLVFGMGITGFNQAAFLRGFEEFLMDLHVDLPFAEKVLDIVFGFENGLVDRIAGYPFGAVKFSDDWGSQQGLIISPDLWRKVMKPHYARQFDLIHKTDKKVWFHTCGNVWDIIPDLIDAGVDVLELLQPDVFGLDRLASEFAGKVCFSCSIDHQREAINGTREEIFDYARRLNESLGGDNGGFIAYIEDYPSLKMGEDRYQWICEAFESIARAPQR